MTTLPHHDCPHCPPVNHWLDSCRCERWKMHALAVQTVAESYMIDWRELQ